MLLDPRSQRPSTAKTKVPRIVLKGGTSGWALAYVEAGRFRITTQLMAFPVVEVMVACASH